MLGYAAGPMVLRLRLGDVDPVGLVTASLATAAVVLAPLGLASAPHALPSATVLASIAVLGVACSALAFVLFATLIQEVGPGRAAVITVRRPRRRRRTRGDRARRVARRLALSVAGLLLILAGSWLSTHGRLPPGTAALAARLRRGRRPRPGAATPPARP